MTIPTPAATLEQQFDAMFSDPELHFCGDVIRGNGGNMALYWSPIQWNDPPTALIERRDEWLWLGQPGWYADSDSKRRYLQLEEFMRDMNPQYPNEWVRLDEMPEIYEENYRLLHGRAEGIQNDAINKSALPRPPENNAAITNRIIQRMQAEIGLGYEELVTARRIVAEELQAVELEPMTQAEGRQQYEDITEAHA